MNKNWFHSRFAKNTSWLIVGQIYQMVLTLLVGVFSARYLGPSNFGLINYVVSFVTLFNAFCTLGTENILVNELVNNPEQEGAICGTAIRMRLVSSAVCAGMVVLLVFLLNPGERLTVCIAAVYSITLLFKCFDSLNLWFQAKLLSQYTAIVSAVAFTIVSAYKVFLLVTQKSVLWFAATNVIESALIALLLAVCYYRCNGAQPLRYDGRMVKGLFAKSHHFILSGMMVAIYGQMDKIMLKSMMDETAVGLYTAGSSISVMWVFVLSAVVSSARPLILENFHTDKKRYEDLLIKLYSAVSYISFFVAAGISLFAPLLVWILYGKAYLAAKSVLRILAWSTAFSYMGVIRGIWLVPHGKQKYEKYIAAAGAGCNLLLNYLLIPAYGANGAAAATLITQVFTNFIVGFVMRDIRHNNVLIAKSLILPFTMAVNWLKRRKKDGT